MTNNKGYVKTKKDGKLSVPKNFYEDEETKKLKERKEKCFQIFKWSVILLFGYSIYTFYNQIILYFIDILNQNPTIYHYYTILQAEIDNSTLKGLFLISTLGSLFFLILPSEAVFIYYLSSTVYNPLLVLVFTVFGTIAGLCFNYFFGKILGKKVLKFIFNKNFNKYQDKINEYGGMFLIIGNILPGPIEVLAVFYGGFKFSFARFVYLSMFGRMIKYMILFVAFFFFWDSLTLYYDKIIGNVLILKDLFI